MAEICLCALALATLAFGAEKFEWNWHDSEELTYKQSLQRTNVTPAQRASIRTAIAAQLRPEMSELGIMSEDTLENLALDARIKLADINEDGVPEVIVQGAGEAAGCSPTGNCPFWVFQKAGPGYKLLFRADSVQTFTIQHHRSRGYCDIVVGTHESATEQNLRLFRYRDGIYHNIGCYEAYWWVFVGSTLHELKNPRISPCTDR